MSEQGDFNRPEKSLEKRWQVDNEARISKKAKMKIKFQQKSEAHNSARHSAKLSNIPANIQGDFQICISVPLKYYPFDAILFGLGWVEDVRVYTNSHFLKRDFGILIKINYRSKSATVTLYPEFQTLSSDEKI